MNVLTFKLFCHCTDIKFKKFAACREVDFDNNIYLTVDMCDCTIKVLKIDCRLVNKVVQSIADI